MKKILKETLHELGGEIAIKIAEILLKNKGKKLSAEHIAEKSELDIKDIRKVLYILQDLDLVKSHKTTNEKKHSSYFYWVPTFENVNKYLIQKYQENIDELKQELDFSEKVLFECEECQEERYPYTEAMRHDFLCPICKKGELVSMNNTEKVKSLKEEIESLKKKQKALSKEK